MSKKISTVKQKISVIIATLNEEKAIAKTVNDCKKHLKGFSYEILVIDGISTDRTVERAKRAGAKVIVSERSGKGIALQLGVKKCTGDIIVTLDGDATYPAKFIPKMIELLDDCDIVVGSRLLATGTIKEFMPYIQFKIVPFLMKGIYGKFKTSEPFSGMRAIRKSDWIKLDLKSEHFVVETEMEVKMVKNRFKIIEIPIPCISRKGKGRSKLVTSPGQWWKIYKFIKKNEKVLEKDAFVYKVIEY